MQLLCTNGGNGIVMCAMWVSLFVSVSVLFVCHCRRLSPKNLLSWPTSGNARGQSACGGRLRQTLVWPLRWVGALALPRSRPSGFFAGKAGKDTFTNPPLRRLVRAARCRLGAVAGGASRAICVPRQSVPSCRRARPCGLAPRHGLHPPSAAPSPPPSLRSLRRLRCPPCGSWARVQIRPYATWRALVMTRCVPAILSETRIPKPEEIIRILKQMQRPPTADWAHAFPNMGRERSFSG